MFYFPLEALTLMDMEEAANNQCALNFREKYDKHNGKRANTVSEKVLLLNILPI